MCSEELDLKKLFFWFCENHAEDATGSLKPFAEKVFINLKENKQKKENEEIFEHVSNDCLFLEFFEISSKSVFSIEDEYFNLIFKWYDFYFLEGTDLETTGPHKLNDALHSHYICSERSEDDFVKIKYDLEEISWEEMQDFMSGVQPSVGRIINLNDADYEQVSPGKWCLSEQSGQFS